MMSYAYNREKSELFYDNDDQYDRQRLTGSTARTRGTASSPPRSSSCRSAGAAGSGPRCPRASTLVLGGWQIAGVYTYRSGQFLRFGAMVAPESVTKLGGAATGAYWFDTTGFATPPGLHPSDEPLAVRRPDGAELPERGR